MKINNQNTSSGDDAIEIRLWNYIDGRCDAQEQSLIQKLIAENTVWKQTYAELLNMQQLIRATELEQPSMRFTKNVMDEIKKHAIAPAAKKYINLKIIWSIAAFFIIVIGGILIYSISAADWSVTPATPKINMPSVDYSRFFNSTYINLFIMVNIILGLMLLDRILTNKKKKFAD